MSIEAKKAQGAGSQLRRFCAEMCGELEDLIELRVKREREDFVVASLKIRRDEASP